MTVITTALVTALTTTVVMGAIAIGSLWLVLRRGGATETRREGSGYSHSYTGTPRCRCIDCGGTEPVHDPWCVYMAREFGDVA